MEGNVNWIPLGILGLIVVIWATKFLTAIRLKQKLKKAWDGAPFFRKKDTEESLIDSLAYPAKGKTIDSQVDDQTWHDLALDAVFDQLNYTPIEPWSRGSLSKKCACWNSSLRTSS